MGKMCQMSNPIAHKYNDIVSDFTTRLKKMRKQEIHVVISSDLEEIFPMFLDNRKKDITQITQFLATQSLEEIQVIAHKLAGNAGSYGLEALGEIGARMEMGCIKKDSDIVKSEFEQFKNYLENLTITFD